MPIRFEAYRMRDGVTPLAQDYFNPVLGDIDARIADMEARRDDLQAVTDELTRFGLQRIDSLLGPSMAEVNAIIAYLYQKRAELEGAVGNIANLATTGQLNTAIAIEQTARAAAIATATAPVTAMAAGYTGNRITSITEDGKTTTITYNGDGTVNTISWPRAGKTRTETYTYSAGRVTGMNATEA